MEEDGGMPVSRLRYTRGMLMLRCCRLGSGACMAMHELTMSDMEPMMPRNFNTISCSSMARMLS